MIQCLSLGLGIQSTTLYYISSLGAFERPNVAVFADTGAEHQETYIYLEKLLEWQTKNNGIPVIIINEKNIYSDYMNTKKKGIAKIPAFSSSGGKLPRQCTTEYKTKQVHTALREFLGLRKKQKSPLTEMWLGISIDEIYRMKESKYPRIKNRWPLIELKMSRNDCIRWLETRGFEVPKRSACIFCPFKSDSEWKRITKNSEEMRIAIDIDERIRRMDDMGLRDSFYLHRSLRPIKDLPFGKEQQDLFFEECEGMCGV